MWRNLKLIHLWRNFSFLHMFHVQKCEITWQIFSPRVWPVDPWQISGIHNIYTGLNAFAKNLVTGQTESKLWTVAAKKTIPLVAVLHVCTNVYFAQKMNQENRRWTELSHLQRTWNLNLWERMFSRDGWSCRVKLVGKTNSYCHWSPELRIEMLSPLKKSLHCRVACTN